MKIAGNILTLDSTEDGKSALMVGTVFTGEWSSLDLLHAQLLGRVCV